MFSQKCYDSVSESTSFLSLVDFPVDTVFKFPFNRLSWWQIYAGLGNIAVVYQHSDIIVVETCIPPFSCEAGVSCKLDNLNVASIFPIGHFKLSLVSVS